MKRILKVLIIIPIILMLTSSLVFAGHKFDASESNYSRLYNWDSGLGQSYCFVEVALPEEGASTENYHPSYDAVNKLREEFGYTGDRLYETMYIKTTAKISKSSTYKKKGITFGDDEHTNRVKKEDAHFKGTKWIEDKRDDLDDDMLKDYFGWDGKKDSWDVILKVKVDGLNEKEIECGRGPVEDPAMFDPMGIKDNYKLSNEVWDYVYIKNDNKGYWAINLEIDELITEQDDNWAEWLNKVENSPGEGKEIDYVQTISEKIVDKYEDVKEGVDDVKTFVSNLGKNFLGTIVGLLLDVTVRLLADVMQMIANLFQMVGVNNILKDTRITYSKDYLISSGTGNDSKNKYTNVTDYDSKGKSPIGKRITIKNEGDDDEGFTEKTEIPVIPVDLYNIAIGDISILDVNFLKVDKDLHDENSIWTIMRNFISFLIHLAMYIAAAVLLTSLIWHGINIVKGSIDSPLRRREHVQGFQRFAKGILMLVGTILIEALCIYGSQMFFEEVKLEDTNELPIRVNVEEAGYSFSTNATGYMRYMTEIPNVDLYAEKAMYTFAYFGLALVNLVAVVFMFFRMIAMMLLAAIGPLIVVGYVFNGENRITQWGYRTWVGWYVSLAMIQIVLALVYRIILNGAIN